MNQNPGQKQLQEMMARAQKQMEDQRMRGMQAAWVKQQEEARRQAEAAQSSQGAGSSSAGWQSGSYFQIDERFSRVEAEVAQLKQQRAAGKLSEDKFNEALKNLMVEDDDHCWWMVGTTSGAWHRFDGQNWVPATPPGRWVQGSGAPGVFSTQSAGIVRPKGHPFGAFILFIVLLPVVATAGFFMGQFIYEGLEIRSDTVAFIFAGAVWAIGLFLDFKLARRTWRGY